MSEAKPVRRNALAQSRSPYLLQHASNPVDWKEWGEPAFEEAKRRGVPIFLSIGYSTCHWCHVMAHESFEDEAIAGRMNDLFVNVKLDREERPDIDRIYMSSVQATSGSGGWPMSVWLTPDLQPIYGGTYFPPQDKYGRIGFATLIERIGTLWLEKPDEAYAHAKRSMQMLAESSQSIEAGTIEDASRAIDLCLEQLDTDFDTENGGFSRAPKFPMHAYHSLLLECGFRLRNRHVVERISLTLSKMARGGIHDHLAGGFHRYSVDEYWHVPHFEKMLYDQAQLAIAYAEGFKLCKNEYFSEVARNIVRYVRESLMGPKGALFAAEDADSPLPSDPTRSGEGAFYTWTADELLEVLNEDAEFFKKLYVVAEKGNVRPESDPHGELEGVNVLTLADSIPGEDLDFARLNKVNESLLSVRSARPRPHLDDKTLTSWSALMISGAAKVYQACGDEDALDLAIRGLGFLKSEMWNAGTGELFRVYREGRSDLSGFAEDYASLALACIDLYESTFDFSFLEWAEELLAQLEIRFLDTENGGYFSVQCGQVDSPLRSKDDYDGAEPSASSLAALAQLKLAALLDSSELRNRAKQTIEAFGGHWSKTPRAMAHMLVAAYRFLEADQQIVIVGETRSAEFKSLVAAANAQRPPYSTLMAFDSAKALPERLRHNQSLVAMLDSKELALAYVCSGFVCQEPVRTVDALLSALEDQ